MNYFEPNLTPDELRAISAIGLAHHGGRGVRDCWCAHGCARTARRRARQLHRCAALQLVCAPEAGGAGASGCCRELTEEEQAVFRRGRNANVHSIPAHASRAQYQQATALEALFGWLYLQGRRERVNELFSRMMEEE